MAANGISELATKELRQLAKLDIAQLKRQGYATIVQNTTAYSLGTDFNLGDIKITVNNVDDVYLHFYNSVPAISNLITVGMIVTIDWDGRAPNTVAYIASPLIDFPGHAWRAQGLGFLLTIITTTELPGNSEDYNIEALHIPNGTFTGSGSPDTSAPFYRARAYYDLTQLPTQYDDNTVVDNANAGGLVVGRPWISTPPIITEGLVLHLDAGDTDSYPGTGTTWYDLSPSGKNATVPDGSVFYSSADGGSMSFLGSSLSVATITSASAITGLTNNMTIEVWYKSSGNITPRFLSTGAGSDGICFGSWTTTPTKWKVSKYGQVDLYVGSVPQNANVWQQAVVVYSSTEGTKIYVDGVLSETNADTTSIQGSSTPTITIGKVESTYHKGDISIIRWYNTVLSDAEILQNYNANIGRYTNPASVANLVIYYDPSNPISYLAGSSVFSLGASAFTGALANITHTNPYFTYNGNNSWILLSDGAGYEPGSGDFSVEIWVYHSVIAGSSRVIVGKTDNGGLASNWSYGLRTGADGSTYFEVGNGTTSIQSPSFTLSTGQWYQVVGVWTNVGTKTMELYVNGESKGSIVHAFTSVKNSSRGLYIGVYNGNEYAQSLNGRTGVFRQYNKALTSAEVLQNFENDRGLYGI